MSTRHVYLQLAAILLCLSGCGDSPTDRTATGNPAGRDEPSGEVPAAPVDIPDVIQGQGLPIDEAREQFETKLREACGGELCLQIVVEETDENFQTCTYSGHSRPDGGTSVDQETEVVLIAGSQPCDSDRDGVPDAEETTDEPTDQPIDEPTNGLDDGTTP